MLQFVYALNSGLSGIGNVISAFFLSNTDGNKWTSTTDFSKGVPVSPLFYLSAAAEVYYHSVQAFIAPGFKYLVLANIACNETGLQINAGGWFV
jgi:hypothetical protein